MAMIDYRLITIEVETVIGESEDIDKGFFEYLDEYFIIPKILEKEENQEWPIVEYTGGPVSLSNMLKEKFGMSREEIEQNYPQLKRDEQ